MTRWRSAMPLMMISVLQSSQIPISTRPAQNVERQRQGDRRRQMGEEANQSDPPDGHAPCERCEAAPGRQTAQRVEV